MASMFDTVALVEPPPGTTMYSLFLNEQQTDWIDVFGIERMWKGLVSYSGSSYTPGAILRYQPNKIRVIVTNPAVTGPEINAIGALTLDLFQLFHFASFTRQTVVSIDELQFKNILLIASRFSLHAQRAIKSQLEESLSTFGVMAQTLEEAIPELDAQWAEVVAKLKALHVLLVEHPFGLGFPLDKFA